jgi:hypothetical protein
MTARVVALIGITSIRCHHYYAKVRGITNSYVDYYVTATDNRGNGRSPSTIWVGAGQPGGGGGNPDGCNGRVCVSPAQPVAGAPVTVQFTPAGDRWLARAQSTSTSAGTAGSVVSPDPR